MSEMKDVANSAKAYFATRPEWSERYEKLMSEAFSDEEVQQFLHENKENLTEQEIINSYSKLFEFVKEKKKILANESNQLAKGFRPKLVLNHHYIDVEYVPTEEYLVYEEKREIENLIECMNISREVRKANLANLNANSERQKALIEMNRFLQELGENPKGYHQGLFLYGNFGVGKSYILGVIANELAKRKRHTLMVHFPSFVEEIKASFKDNSASGKIEQLKKAEILMIDDIGAEALTDWSRDSVLGVILQYRMQEEKTTFFSSNMSFAEFSEHLTITKNNNEEPLKAQRIMERVKFLSREVRMGGENLRPH